MRVYDLSFIANSINQKLEGEKTHLEHITLTFISIQYTNNVVFVCACVQHGSVQTYFGTHFMQMC